MYINQTERKRPWSKVNPVAAIHPPPTRHPAPTIRSAYPKGQTAQRYFLTFMTPFCPALSPPLSFCSSRHRGEGRQRQPGWGPDTRQSPGAGPRGGGEPLPSFREGRERKHRSAGSSAGQTRRERGRKSVTVQESRGGHHGNES